VKPYQNVSGDSGVTHYEVLPTAIRIRFRNGSVYVYDYTTPGKAHVEQMKRLAAAGRGLSTYISQHVSDSYARKER
jgi:hypothetical protein